VLENRHSREYPKGMSVNWLKVAQKMAEDARAQLAINRQRLREIIEKRDKQQTTQQHPTNAQ
jgi:exonuclease VII small subunit